MAVDAGTHPAHFAFAGFLLVGLQGFQHIVPVLFSAAGERSPDTGKPRHCSVTAIGYAGILIGPATIGFVAQHWSLSAALLLVGGGMALFAHTWPMTARQRTPSASPSPGKTRSRAVRRRDPSEALTAGTPSNPKRSDRFRIAFFLHRQQCGFCLKPGTISSDNDPHHVKVVL